MGLKFGVVFAAILLFSACGEDEENRLKVDVSDVKVDLTFKRLDQDLAKVDTSNFKAFNDRMLEEYGDFWVDYAAGILRQGNPHDPMFPDNMKTFFQRDYVAATMRAVDSSFSSVDKYNKGIKQAFKYLKYYYPDSTEPKVIYSNNFFNYAAVATRDVLNVGLDFYLGSDHWIIKSLPTREFPEYIKDDMSSEYLVVDAMSIWFESNYLGGRDFAEFLDALIFFGKQMYALDAMMPDVADHIKMKCSSEDMIWFKRNEERIWLTMVDRQMVRSRDKRLIEDYFMNRPFTPGLTGDKDVPARAGVFMGWQIVRDFMDASPNLSLPDLMKERNTQTILSKYKQGK